MSGSKSGDEAREAEKVHLDRGRFDEGQATDEDLATETRKPHGRYDEGERTGADAEPGATRGRYDRGQADEADLTTEARKAHGRYDDGERTAPPPSDDPQNVY